MVGRCGEWLNEYHQIIVILSVVKAWVGLTTAQIARAVRIYRNGCTPHRMSGDYGLFLHMTVSIQSRRKQIAVESFVVKGGLQT